MKKALQIISILSLIVIVSGCSIEKAAKRMSFQLKSVSIKGFTREGFHADLYMQVDNPNRFAVRVSELSYRMSVNDRQIATGRTTGEIKVPSGGFVVAELPVDVVYGELDGRIIDILMGRLDYKIEGEAVFKAWLWSYTLPFESTKRFDEDKARDKRGGKKKKEPGTENTEKM